MTKSARIPASRADVAPEAHQAAPSLGTELVLLGSDLADLFGRYCRRFGLTLAQAQLLDLVARRDPAPLEPWQIGQVLNLGSSNVTVMLDRMVADGHLARGAHPDDGRRRLVRITTQGRDLATRIRAGLTEIEDRILASALTPERRAELGALTADLRHALREMVIPEGRTRPGP